MANWALPEGEGRGRGKFPGHFFQPQRQMKFFCLWRRLHGKIVRRKNHLVY
jgi:hypothetical protein